MMASSSDDEANAASADMMQHLDNQDDNLMLVLPTTTAASFDALAADGLSTATAEEGAPRAAAVSMLGGRDHQEDRFVLCSTWAPSTRWMARSCAVE